MRTESTTNRTFSEPRTDAFQAERWMYSLARLGGVVEVVGIAGLWLV